MWARWPHRSPCSSRSTHWPCTSPPGPHCSIPGTPAEGIPAGGRELAADGFEVYSYDQLGAGRSTRLRDITGYTVARQVADLDAIRRTLGADRIVIVGQSWGGSLAAQYLAAHSRHVAKAVFTSPGALWGHAGSSLPSKASPWPQGCRHRSSTSTGPGGCPGFG
ncbi:alpha/beta fold hydrolase [Streptomyces sp. BE133]|uniref:alpha/beta fold hydrolase n=1 Tax=Streptomyces sp. BE133 TaxID=3002523 RepID=UPI002E77BDB0|nr:alpha/beta fold hydrolase [Streptomyces sp. BE133]MEE1805543.1 alpha/beta fold hydrolase [Streptomyces sp. BE133]